MHIAIASRKSLLPRVNTPCSGDMTSVKRAPHDHPRGKRSKHQKTLERGKEGDVETEFKVVKISLRSFCTAEARLLPWEHVLKQMNKTILEVHIVANLHVIRLCESSEELPSLDQSFFYRCLAGVSVGRNKVKKSLGTDAKLHETIEIYKSWRPDDYKAPEIEYLSAGWHQNASFQMATNAANIVHENFYRRFTRYLKHKYSLSGHQAYEALRDIRAPSYDGQDQLVVRYRAMIPEKSDVHLTIPLQYKFLKYFESKHLITECTADSKQLRLFSLLPFKTGFQCSHMKMCGTGLYGMLKLAGYDVPTLHTSWSDVRDAKWRELFHIAKLETVNQKFTGEITTDGKVVSVLLKKRKKAIDDHIDVPKIELEDFKEVLGLDPGRRDLFVAVGQSGQKIKCSTREFYQDAKYKYSEKKIKKWQDSDRDVTEAIRNMPTKKTATPETLEMYARFALEHLDLLLDFNMRERIRDLRFTRHVMAQKKIDNLCKKLTERGGRRTLIGFSDWSNTDNEGFVKGSSKGPVKKLERRLKHYCKVVSIDEFRTSKLHSVCHTELVNQKSHKLCKDGVVRVSKVHSVLHCRSSGCQGMTVNRDENAARNMLALLAQSVEHGTRPEAFRRSVIQHQKVPSGLRSSKDGRETYRMGSDIMRTAKINSRLLTAAPGDIRFSQDTIPVYFDTPHAEDGLDKAVELILSKRLSADDFPHMRVLLVNDQLWTLNNRTLWVLRKARVAQVVVRLQGQFDDDRNPFLSSYKYKLLSPREFFPQVRGECRLDFDHPSEWSDVHTDMGIGPSSPSEGGRGIPDPPIEEHMEEEEPVEQPVPAHHKRLSVAKPCYRKVVYNHWSFIHIWPLQTNDTFTEKERKQGVRFYVCTYSGCKGHFNLRRSSLESHLQSQHRNNIHCPSVQTGKPAWWEYAPLAPDSEVCISRNRITATLLVSLPASPTQPPAFD